MNTPAPAVTAFDRVVIPVETRSGVLPIAGWASPGAAAQPEIVWLHANGFNAATYRHTLGPLASRFRILILDQRGHGRTPQDSAIEGKTDALDLRDDLLALLRVVAPGRPVILAGHSLGGCVSLLAAAEAPERVRGLALFDPVILSRESSALAAKRDDSVAESLMVTRARGRKRVFASRDEAFETYRTRTIFAGWPEPALRDYILDGFRDLPDGTVELSCAPEWEAVNFAAQGHDTWSAMARVQAPVLICRAETGSTCAVGTTAEFPRPPGQVEVKQIPGSTHFLPMEQPDVVREELARVASEPKG